MSICNRYTMVNSPAREDCPRALARLSPVQADKPWYNYFIPHSLMYNFLSMKYFVLKFAIPGKGGTEMPLNAV